VNRSMSTGESPTFPSKTALRWKRARAESRQCILDAAGTVFAEEGFEHTTMKRIASVCGVTKVTIYAHYRDKERLYTSVMDGHLASMTSGELSLPAGTDLGDALMCIAGGIERLAANPSCLAFCRSLLRSGPGIDLYRERWSTVLEPYLDLAEKAFERVSVGSTCSGDGERFVSLLLAEHGLPQGRRRASDSHATTALFLRACELRVR
jgi:AcrR family transcriptional regulator